MESRLDVAICIASYQRPRGLQALLRGIAGQTFPGVAPSIGVVVADNDPAASAREVASEARAWLPHPLDYVVEPRRGIPHARNAALGAALGRAEWIAFIDDDEVPEPGWLAALLETGRARDADVVAGPVLPRFDGTPPRWVVDGGFFASPRHPDGATVHIAYTHNALVRAAALEAVGARFDERFAFQGEDEELFERLSRDGRRLVWADGARVHDVVPSARARAGWIVARSFRTGRARTRVERLHAPRGVAPRVAVEALRSLGSAAARLVFAGGRAGHVRGLQIAAYAAGRVAGLFARD